MTTLAANKPRDFEIGDIGSYPMVADDIIHAGAFVRDDASGHARPLVSGDAFLGVAIEPADNTADELRVAVTLDVSAYRWLQVAYAEDGVTGTPGDLALSYSLSA